MIKEGQRGHGGGGGRLSGKKGGLQPVIEGVIWSIRSFTCRGSSPTPDKDAPKYYSEDFRYSWCYSLGIYGVQCCLGIHGVQFGCS